MKPLRIFLILIVCVCNTQITLCAIDGEYNNTGNSPTEITHEQDHPQIDSFPLDANFPQPQTLTFDEWNAYLPDTFITRRYTEDRITYGRLIGVDDAEKIVSIQQLHRITELVATVRDFIKVINGNEVNRQLIESYFHQLFRWAYEIVFYDVRLIQQFWQRGTSGRRYYDYIVRNFYQNTNISAFLESTQRQSPGAKERLYSLIMQNAPKGTQSEIEVQLQIAYNPYLNAILKMMLSMNLETCLENPRSIAGILTEFEASIKSRLYFDTHLAPLVWLQSRINMITPILDIQPDDLTDKHAHYVAIQISLLGQDIQTLLSHEIRDASKSIANTKNPQRVACYAGLPLREIETIASSMTLMIHQSRTIPFNPYLREIIEDLRELNKQIHRLLLIETQIYTNTAVGKINMPGFLKITKYANRNRDIWNLFKITEYLEKFLQDNSRSEFDILRRYAVIRVLEVIGEAGKNLNQSNAFWKKMGKLRDCLTHSKRNDNNTKLCRLIYEHSDTDLITRLINGNDFRTLLTYINEQISALLNNSNATITLPQLPDIHAVVSLFKPPPSLTEEEKYRLRNTLKDQHNLGLILDALEKDTHDNDQDGFNQLVNRTKSLTKNERKKIKEDYKKKRTPLKTNRLFSISPAVRTILSTRPERQGTESDLEDIINDLTSFENLSLLIKKLEDFDISDMKPWEEIYKAYRKSTDSENRPTNNTTPNLETESEKANAAIRKLQSHLESTLDIYNALDLVTLEYRESDNCENLATPIDPLFAMAYEHLSSALRESARPIIAKIALLKDYKAANGIGWHNMNPVLEDFEHELRESIMSGNAIAHIHDITEFFNFRYVDYRRSTRGLFSPFIPIQDAIRICMNLANYILSQATTPEPTSLVGEISGNKLVFREIELARDHNCGFHGIGVKRQHAVNQLLGASNNTHIRSLVAPEIRESALLDPRYLWSLENLDSNVLDWHTRYFACNRIIDTIVLHINNIREAHNFTKINREDAIDFVSQVELNDSITIELRNRFLQFRDKLLAAQQQQQELENWLHDFSNKTEVYEYFVAQYRNQTEWLSYVRGSTGILDALAQINNLSVYVWGYSGNPNQLELIHQTPPTNTPDAYTIHLLHRDGLTHFNRLEEVAVSGNHDTACRCHIIPLSNHTTPPQSNSHSLYPYLINFGQAQSQ